MDQPISDFHQFWPYYVGEHRQPLNRRLHFIGTSLSLSAFIAALAGAHWLFVAAPLCGYGFAWVGHFFVEKNRPATFRYPVWSLRGDFVMWWKMLTGKMDAELRTLGVGT